MSTEGKTSTESLDLGALKELCALANHRMQVHPEDGWAEDFADHVPALIAEVERLRGALDQVRALHVSDDGDGTPCCAEDGFIWPCTTARILASLDADHTDTKEQA